MNCYSHWLNNQILGISKRSESWVKVDSPPYYSFILSLWYAHNFLRAYPILMYILISLSSPIKLRVFVIWYLSIFISSHTTIILKWSIHTICVPKSILKFDYQKDFTQHTFISIYNIISNFTFQTYFKLSNNDNHKWN